jgi:hypothetical protein
MDRFTVSDWFANRAKLKIQMFSVESFDFELMALNESLADDVKLCDTYEEMLSLAASSGISYNRKRVVDDEELAKDIDMFWGLDDLDIDLDPCIKYRVGEKVCEISGLNSTLEETLETEKQAAIAIDGDNLPNDDVTIGQLEEDANNYSAPTQ